MCVAKNDIVETGEANLSIHVGGNRYDAFPFYKRFVVLFRDVSSSSNCHFHPMFKANILFLHAFKLCLKSLQFWDSVTEDTTLYIVESAQPMSYAGKMKGNYG